FCGVMPMCSATVLRRILRFASMTSRLTTIGTRAPRSNQEVLLFTHFAADVHDPRDHEYYGPCDQLHERTGTVGFQKGRAAFRRNEIRRDREREPKDGEEQYRDADLSDLLNAFLLEDAALGIVPEQLLQVEEKLEQDRKAEKTADPADHVGRPGYGLTAILREPDAKVAETSSPMAIRNTFAHIANATATRRTWKSRFREALYLWTFASFDAVSAVIGFSRTWWGLMM